MEEVPVFLKRLDPKKKPDISFEELRKLETFNTSEYWWCFFDCKTYNLYNQYARLILEDGRDYLIKKGHLDKDLNFIKEFSD